MLKFCEVQHLYLSGRPQHLSRLLDWDDWIVTSPPFSMWVLEGVSRACGMFLSGFPLTKTPRQASLESCGDKRIPIFEKKYLLRMNLSKWEQGSGGAVTIALKGTTLTAQGGSPDRLAATWAHLKVLYPDPGSCWGGDDPKLPPSPVLQFCPISASSYLSEALWSLYPPFYCRPASLIGPSPWSSCWPTPKSLVVPSACLA